jgi:hypothetical protein
MLSTLLPRAKATGSASADRTLQRVELYDLAASRFEVFDVAAQEPEQAERMVDTIRRLAADVAVDPIRR